MCSYINVFLYMDILYNIWLYMNVWMCYTVTFNWTCVQLTRASTNHHHTPQHIRIFAYVNVYPQANWTVVHLIYTPSHCLITRTKRETCLTLNISPLQARKGFSGMSAHKNPIPCNLLFLFCLFIYRYKQLI